jgi:hypothetical protein
VTEARLTKRRNVLERNYDKVIALVLEGASDHEIARQVKCAPRSVGAFKTRHKAELTRLSDELNDKVANYTISNIVNRIADAQLRRDLLVAVAEARAKGLTGEETGIVMVEERVYGSGPGSTTVKAYRVDTAFLAEWRQNDKHVAEQLGQLPKPEMNFDLRKQTVNIYRDVPSLRGGDE